MIHGPDPLGYPGAGATGKSPAYWPEGFRTLRVSSRVGRGDTAFAVAADAVMTWRLHRKAGVRLDTCATRAAPGVEVVVGLGIGPFRLHAPCRVVWTVEEEGRTGWAYGTLPGHPVRGEEGFVVVQDDDGTVRLEVLAFSLPSAWFTVAAGPLLPVFQRWYARRCGRVLSGLVRDATGTGGHGAPLRDGKNQNGIDGTEHP